ncbi:phasin family protein [Ovoidimarina sediminis]|uniref:phasin family protein n=1 Tax=Ovoidimarina sediminis TaxID=3079856 RepID=UPI002909D3D7|nr:phasin family protein [Rhodophyticola sp. MJ-SS7]MDU8945819.1 phasin family protein [Rhodophyticola sp. MJ-SS7]
MASPEKKEEVAENIGTPEFTAAMMAVSPVATKAWLDIMSESAKFVMERLQQDMETQKAILACKSPMELMQVQSDFISTAVKQYTEEVTRLFNVMSKATEETIEETRSGHSRGYDDVPL